MCCWWMKRPLLTHGIVQYRGNSSSIKNDHFYPENDLPSTSNVVRTGLWRSKQLKNRPVVKNSNLCGFHQKVCESVSYEGTPGSCALNCCGEPDLYTRPKAAQDYQYMATTRTPSGSRPACEQGVLTATVNTQRPQNEACRNQIHRKVSK